MIYVYKILFEDAYTQQQNMQKKNTYTLILKICKNLKKT